MALKEKALRRLAERLNAAGIPWAAGGEWLMYHKGILDSYHQFDIVVSPEDAPRADAVLTRLGMRTPYPEAPDAFRCAYHFDGADVMLYAGIAAQGEALSPLSQGETAAVLGAAVPLCALAPWQRIYRAFGSARLAEAVGAYLNQQQTEE